ncbi:MAG: ABC transporter ATP-binding protein [Microbacteriaceae bacterium]|nr:ABC transporter ATP-binding protein [Microbacteriaceae bacterium]
MLVLGHDGRPVLEGAPHEVFVGGAEVLESLGVWQPVATVAAAALRRAGLDVGAPLTIEALRTALRSTGTCTCNSRSGSGDAAVDRGGGPSGPADSTGGCSCDSRAGRAGDAVRADSGSRVASPDSTDAATGSGDAVPGPGDATTGPGDAPILTAAGLTVRRAGRTLLDDATLRIRPGEFVAVAGPNGAGKTTLLQALAGIVAPPRGTVAVDGRDVARLRVRELRDRIGYVFQNPEHQFLATTVRDELALELRNQGFADDAVDARVAESLARFGLDGLAELHPFLLSGGQKRRLSVATALVSGASVLVLDEPTFGQDRARAAELVAVLTELNAAGTTVIMATHDLQLAAEVADRLVVVADARIAADGPVREVLASGVLDEVGIGQPPLVRAFGGLADERLRGITRMRDLPGAETGAVPAAGAGAGPGPGAGSVPTMRTTTDAGTGVGRGAGGDARPGTGRDGAAADASTDAVAGGDPAGPAAPGPTGAPR